MQEVPDETIDIPDDANIRHSDGSYTESEFGGGSRSDLFLLLRTARFYVQLVVFFFDRFVRQIGQRRWHERPDPTNSSRW